MSSLKQPIIGQKPICPKHPENHIDWTCAAGLCPYRVLCKECLAEHTIFYPHHCDQLSPLNDWYKQYLKVAKNFDPRESYQMVYHIEEVGMILKKEKYELEKISKKLNYSFDAALNILVSKLNSLKEHLYTQLWQDYNNVNQGYESIMQKFAKLQDFDPKGPILESMKQDLHKYFTQNNLKEYFDRVYTGHYDEKVFNTHLNSKNMISNLKKRRQKLEEGFKIFDDHEFEKKWVHELDKFIKSIEASCDDGIFKRIKLDLLNPKSPKIAPVSESPNFAKVTCLTSLEGLTTSFVAKANDGLFLTLSEQRSLNFLDPCQSFRSIKRSVLGQDPILSADILPLDSSIIPHLPPPASFLLLIGGNEDFPSIEVWDCLRNKKLACIEDVHEYGVSCLKTLKKEKIGENQIFNVASGSSDGFIKLWEIQVSKPETGDPHHYKVTVNLLTKIEPHGSFISSIVSIPQCVKYPSSTLISSSHDKSLFIWEWEKELTQKKNSTRNTPLEQNNESNEVDTESFSKKIECAHNDRINSIVLLNDQKDYSDLEFYATGGGEGLIKIWRLTNGEMVKTFSNTNHPIFSMEYLGYNKIACTANDVCLKNYYVLIWNWRTSSLLLCIRDHHARVCKVLSLRDGIFVTCDKSKTIKLWQLENSDSESDDDIE